MRKATLAAIGTSLLAACSHSAPAGQGPAQPQAAVAALEHDFGIIPHGEKREHEFLLDLRPLGEPVVPLRVHLDCSCGLADLRLRHRDGSERPVDGDPGPDHAARAEETLVVRVVLDTNGKEAVDLPKTVSHGYVVLQPTRDLTGNLRVNWPIKLHFGIDAPVVLRPFAALDFGRVPVSATGEVITHLRGDEAHPGMTFGPVASTDPLVSVAIEPAADHVVLRARCQPGEPGNHRAIVAIGTNLPSGYRVHLNVTWKAVPDLEATPLSKISFRADLSRAQNAAEATGQFVIVTDHLRNRSPEFAVHQIVADDGRDLSRSFEARLAPIPGQDRQHRLLVRYVGGLTGAVRGTVVLTKDGARGPFLPIELVLPHQGLMKVLSPVLAASALLLGTLVATLAQCGDRAVAAVPPTQDPKAAAPLPHGTPTQPGDSVRLLVSGSMHGRLEPCGCASGQLGGLARRMQHIGEQRTYDILLEGGDLVEGATELDVLKLYSAVSILFQMERPYDALGIGQKDLLLPRPEWSAFVGTAPVVASDLVGKAPDWPAKPFVEKDVRGQKVRIASFTLSLPGTPDPTLRLLPPTEAWARALKDAADSTLRVLLLHGPDTTARALIPQLKPAPDLVVCMDAGYIEPSASPSLIGGVPLLFAGIRGRVLLDVRLSRQPTGPRAVCELVPLPGSKTVPGGGGEPNVKDALLAHRHQVKTEGVLGRMVRQVPTGNGASYVGSSNCKSCHPSAAAAWQKSRHFGAWETLVKAEADAKRYGWPVTAYPDCVSCHVVGFREQTGFVSFEETPDLAGVGCERCHGPGSDHVLSNGQKKMGILGGVLSSVLCTQCHDFEQSPDFLYQDKWKLIEHACEPGQKKN